MSRIIQAPNVNHALLDGIWWLRSSGIRSESRNGPVIRAPGPVLTEYHNPTQRLCFNPVRDANHVFHLMETIWMLAGQKNVNWLLPFNSKFGQYAEEGGDQHGAYGYRWRNHFGVDQLAQIVGELRIPNNRRVVLQMWDAKVDLGAKVADVPCNTHAYFEVIAGRLNMTVSNRSNDMIWGAYGANAVHFSMLQELIALELDLEVGTYYQFSNNFHCYLNMGVGKEMMENPPHETYDYYDTGLFNEVPLLQPGETLHDFLVDCSHFIMTPGRRSNTHFMREVAEPLRVAYLSRKVGAEFNLATIADSDWKYAFKQWANRRDQK